MQLLKGLPWLCLLPVVGGTIYGILTVFTTQKFLARPMPQPDFCPGVSVFKPVCGLEKNLDRNLRSLAQQDYPDYQIIYSVQNANDAALPILQAIATDFGPERITVVVAQVQMGANGKVNNLLGALPKAKHDIFVISDSDTCLRPDYLKTLVSPLADPQVGCVCTPFKLTEAQSWYEALELLTINTDFMPSVLFAEVTGAAKACLGPSLAIRRSTLDALGGLASLADYLVEDYELGRRVWTSGLQMVLLPYVIDAVVDLDSWQAWWRHQVYWDQNTFLARPAPFVMTILIRAVPFAVLLTLLQPGNPLSWGLFGMAIALRWLTAVIVARQLQDKESLRHLGWLPLRDCFGLIFWALAFSQRQVTWRGVTYTLTEGGKMVSLAPHPPQE